MLAEIGCRWAFCEVQLHSKAGVLHIDITLARVTIDYNTRARGEICPGAVLRYTVYAVNDWSGS